jgi:uncharacterized membrane protein
MQSETSRIEAFSDGVFAIAITLLILEIKIPTQAQGSLTTSLLRQWPSYLGFLMSFMFIGIMWINHHRMFTLIKRSTDALLVLNLFLLLGVTVVPFPTAVLTGYLGGPEQKVAVIFYNAVFVVIGVMFNVLWRYVVSHRLIDPSTLHSAAVMSKQYAFGPVVYLICLALAWVSVKASLTLGIGIAIFFVLSPSFLGRRK